MTLLTKLAAFIGAVGADIKSLRANSAAQGAYRGEWGILSAKKVLNFENGVPAEFADAIGKGWTVVDEPDSIAGLTKSLKSPFVAHNGSLSFDLAMPLAGTPPQFVTRLRPSSEATYDIATIRLNNVLIGTYSGTDPLWLTHTATATAQGLNTLRFTFGRDSGGDRGDNGFYISQIIADVADPAATYKYGDTVTYFGALYFCLKTGTLDTPDSSTQWYKLQTTMAPVKTLQASATLGYSDSDKYIRVDSPTPVVITVPLQSAVPWEGGAEIHLEQAGHGSVTIAPAAGVTINRLASNNWTTVGQFAVVTLKRTSSDTWTLLGALGVT